MHAAAPSPDSLESTVRAIERPHKNLLWLYVCMAALTLFGFPFVFVPLFFRYETLRYKFDDDGVHASWGILFRREVSLAYSRIQDIHLRRNLLERWLGIGSVQIQTASGSASAELSIEGVTQFVEVRDFLYSKMRGAKGEGRAASPAGRAGAGAGVQHGAAGDLGLDGDAVALLREIRDELRGARAAIEGRKGGPHA